MVKRAEGYITSEGDYFPTMKEAIAAEDLQKQLLSILEKENPYESVSIRELARQL